VNGPQLAKHIGISYRQVDYWTRQGWIYASLKANSKGDGCGHSRSYSDEEVALAGQIAQWVRFGVTPTRAVELIGDGVSLGWSVGRLLNEGAG